jgi:hypothetical protein
MTGTEVEQRCCGRPDGMTSKFLMQRQDFLRHVRTMPNADTDRADLELRLIGLSLRSRVRSTRRTAVLTVMSGPKTFPARK